MSTPQPTGEHSGRVPFTLELIGPYDSAAELESETADAVREAGIRIPSLYRGTPDALLTVRDDGSTDAYVMSLLAEDGRVIARASGFRPGAGFDFGTDDASDDDEHRARTVDTFGGFLAAALEDPEAAEDWDTLAEDAEIWTDALAVYALELAEREAVEYVNTYRLPRERRGEPAQGTACPHGRALAGEGCPACGAEAGEPIDPCLVARRAVRS